MTIDTDTHTEVGGLYGGRSGAPIYSIVTVLLVLTLTTHNRASPTRASIEVYYLPNLLDSILFPPLAVFGNKRRLIVVFQG